MKQITCVVTIIVLIFCCNFSFAQTWFNIGPEGGFFKDFVIHPTNSNVVYAGSDDGGGVWKSTNAGNSWVLLTKDFPNFTAWHIEIDEQHPDTLYFSELYGRYGILKTTNGGATLSHLNNGFILNKDFQHSGMVIYSGDTLFASTGESSDQHARIGNGLFSSFDGGVNWNYAGLQGLSTPTIEVSDSKRLLVGTAENGLYFSDDAGQTWNIHSDIPDTLTIQQIDKKNGVIVLSAITQGVFLSLDNGITFTNIGMVGDFNFDLAIIQTSPELKIISTGFFGPQLYNSSSGNWTTINSPLFVNQLMIGIGTNGTDIYTGIFSSTQIIKSNDGGNTWTQLPNNPIATEIPAVAITPTMSKIYATLQNSYNLTGTTYNKESLAYSTNNGASWTRTGPMAHGLDVEIDPSDENTLYLSTFANGLFKTTDGFSTWTNSRAGNKLIGDIELDPDNPNHILISEVDLTSSVLGLFKSTNGGNTWTRTLDQLVVRIKHKPNSDTVFTAVENNGIFLSSDKGDTWSISPTYLSNENVLSLNYHQNNLYAGTEEGQLYQIDDQGNVTNISGNWNTTLPLEVKNIEMINDVLFIGLNGAEQDTLHNLNGSVWSSLDFGTTWQNISTDLTNTNIFGPSGIIATPDNELLIATYGGGVFKSSGINISTRLPYSYLNQKLINVYPNPFNEDFVISPLANDNIMKIEIYNIKGQMIYKKRTQNSGIIQIDMGDKPNGIYFVQIIGEENNYKKMIIKK